MCKNKNNEGNFEKIYEEKVTVRNEMNELNNATHKRLFALNVTHTYTHTHIHTHTYKMNDNDHYNMKNYVVPLCLGKKERKIKLIQQQHHHQ